MITFCENWKKPTWNGYKIIKWKNHHWQLSDENGMKYEHDEWKKRIKVSENHATRNKNGNKHTYLHTKYIVLF